MKQKHKVVVEISFSKPVTAKNAVWAVKKLVDNTCDGIQLEAEIVLECDILEISCESFDRVIQGLGKNKS